jgi:fructose-1-phosphate kinase PfkB-like protein
LRNFDFESTPSARMMRLRRRHNVALGGGISVFRVAKLIAASTIATGAVGLQRVQFLNSAFDFAGLALRLICIMPIVKETTG